MRKEIVYKEHIITLKVQLDDREMIDNEIYPHKVSVYVKTPKGGGRTIYIDEPVFTSHLHSAIQKMEVKAKEYIDDIVNPDGSRAGQILMSLGFE